jgi:ATP-binding cassette subfamily B protein/subfamily B ATP-binding cassette protein MsbA
MNQPKHEPNTSKRRFAKFIDKFKSGELKSHPNDEDKEDQDKDKTSKSESADSGEQTGHRGKKKKLTKEEKAARRGYLKVYIRQLWPHWKMVLLMIFLAVCVAVLEIAQPLFGRHIIDNILLTDQTRSQKLISLNLVGGAFLVVVIITRLTGMVRAWCQRLLNVRVVLSLRRALFERLLKLSLDKLSDMKVGGIISRLTDDISKTTGLLQMAVISPSVAVLRLVLAMAILLFINWKLALAALGVIPPIMLLSMIAIRRIRPIYRAIRKDVSFVDGRVGEAFQGIRDVRAFGGEHQEETEYTVGHHTITRMRMFAAKREIILWSSWGMLMGLIGVVITWLGGYWYLSDQATIGDIMAFQFYVFMLLNPVWQIVESLTELQRSLAAMERVFEVLGTPIDKPDREGAVAAVPPVEEIKFENVWFAYNEGTDVIRNFDLTVKGGTVIALVGRSGAGKTTITDLVARFYDPTQGKVLLNGRDLRDYQLRSFRELLGVVQQEVFLFDGTVFDNIAYANRNATYEQVVAAARQANADSFVSELPDGYESMIGERGVKLSGGQRQRLSIARALLADPKILILDEATSNLDTESEQLIQSAMTELLKDRTTFVIAHRLSTITHADQIVVIDEGEIVEVGKHDELINKDGHYAEMIKRQHDSITI